MRNPPRQPVEWVLITGATHGIGLALAKECLRQGMGVAAVGLSDANLSGARETFSAIPNAAYRLLGQDLIETGAIDRVLAWLEAESITVNYLINNAGFGRGGLFENTDWGEYRTMLMLNNQVMVELTYRLLPHLRACRGGILNISSMEATLPLPYKTVYTGTKAFVYNFSLALREEFRHYGVSVSVLCPGPVITNADGLRRLEAQGRRGRLLVAMPDDIAPQAIRGMLTGKAVIVPGWLIRALIATSYVTPRPLRMRILEKLFSRYRDEPATVVSPSALKNVSN
ncbi:SDR family NAD(P)-dependent oxidoreductase [Neolewinella litorea]|uniref:SDR family NAD(P)-dependent oxidoreductase n=1 Tax=Neolewinella litorea TaxID=2562452 RepID=A0A4S4NRR2_9BACT|nr:SDR family NAD(P)-dependent oxidoreductase [Neolewinella litorea]THH41068.1 SDR family NAD(P)-dependent oxidoreductase [Neolewinella litorea]